MKTTNILGTSFGLVLIAASIAMTGCASTQSSALGLHTKAHSAGGVQVQAVQLAKTSDGLLVSGSVGRLVGYGNSPYHHLDVEIVAASGAVLLSLLAAGLAVGNSAAGAAGCIAAGLLSDEASASNCCH